MRLHHLIIQASKIEYQALHVAAYYGQPQLVGLLLEAGANPWHKNRFFFKITTPS